MSAFDKKPPVPSPQQRIEGFSSRGGTKSGVRRRKGEVKGMNSLSPIGRSRRLGLEGWGEKPTERDAKGGEKTRDKTKTTSLTTTSTPSTTSTSTTVIDSDFSTERSRVRSRSESSLFRSLYIPSSFSSTATRQQLEEERKTGASRDKFCRHGVKIGLCMEVECWEIGKVEVVGCEKRGIGTITGLRNWEYAISVEFNGVERGRDRRQIWHRYSGFKRLFDMLREKHPYHTIFTEDESLFPPQKLIKWSKRLAEERKVRLDQFLKKVVADDVLRKDSTFKEFLSLDEESRVLFYEENQNAPEDDITSENLK